MLTLLRPNDDNKDFHHEFDSVTLFMIFQPPDLFDFLIYEKFKWFMEWIIYDNLITIVV